MSKFFRSGSADSDSDSSSSDAPSNNQDESADTSEQQELSIQQDVSDLSIASIANDRPVAAAGASAGRDWLLHALLEERTANQVRNEKDPRFRTEEEIQREAKRRYQLLCQTLAPLNLVSAGLDDDRYTETRQGIRTRLDTVDLRASTDSNALQLSTRTRPSTPLPAPLRRLLTENDAPSIPGSPASIFETGSPYALTGPTRYVTDFEELGPLGRGGYGEVFRVRHHVDGRTYAVKKVPIKPSVLAKLRSGAVTMDDILAEVRAISKFDHANIVRYYNSWVEWSTRTGLISSSSELSSQLPPKERTQDSLSMDSLRRVKTESDTTDDMGQITFESLSRQDDMGNIAFESRSRQDVTSLSVVEETGASSTNGALLPTSTIPLLTLHMQMDVYPMTLADFIDPQPTGTEIAPLSHCFHLETSVRIILAILEGVDYLHGEGNVHRDLKPANIFLRHEENPRATRGTVDLVLCESCRSEGRAQPAKLSVRIGDFGLVTNIAQTSHSPSSPGVGTAIYRPTSIVSNVSPRLDIFAVGIIACELLCKFGTQSERRQKLDALRNGRFPEFIGCPSHLVAKVQEVIGSMLTDEEVEVGDLKGRLGELLERERWAGNESPVLRRVST